MSLCLYIKDKHPEVPMPKKLVLQSPGMQVPPDEKQRVNMEELKKYDVMIPPAFFDRIAPVLAQGDEAYLLSPLLRDISGFPEIDVFYGTHEVMYAYAEDLKEHCEKYGVALNVHIGEGMMHCWGAMEMFFIVPITAHHVFCGAVEWIFVKLGRTQQALETALTLAGLYAKNAG